ncbi:MAG: DUF512 domain-containing protein [Thermoleophilia bacterium]|jgi:putative radical SAM enzyme (TIGR03279 family)
MVDKNKNSDTLIGGIVESVVADSPAADAGIAAADVVLSLNGHPLHDVIDYQFYLSSGPQEMEIDRKHRRLMRVMDCDEGDDPGIKFSSTIFDSVRTCRCACIFCFVDQLPRGLRKTLYLKDDDYRLSFLYGNFITLNNLREEDMLRIEEQRLGPLYVSVHSTDRNVRAQVMGCGPDKAAQGLKNLARLGEAGIGLHAQVVLCPGMNDGETLENTISELAGKYQGIKSVGIVPVAFDEEFLKKRAKSGLRAVDRDDSIKIVNLVTTKQKEYRTLYGNGFVYAADEFYFRAGMPLPGADEYDDFPQYENGIGIAAGFLEDAEELISPLVGDIAVDARVFLLTGTLAAGMMNDVCLNLSRLTGRPIAPLVCENRVFGSHVTVTGLLGGHDVIAAARAAGLTRGDLLIITPSCLDGGAEPRFLDDITLTELDETLECGIMVCPR